VLLKLHLTLMTLNLILSYCQTLHSSLFDEYLLRTVRTAVTMVVHVQWIRCLLCLL
jgi:hypothetical protein